MNHLPTTWNMFVWMLWNQVGTFGSSLEASMACDATDGVQSVHVEVTHPDWTLFAIVYAKGSRLMVMLRKWLGDEDFAAGLALIQRTYGNTVGDNLWDALAEVSGKDVAAFMHSWVKQRIPVVLRKSCVLF
ncbi:Aminopeptidase N [Lactococcus lactis]|nr:Aminopeptidase N [Lactococcus lactis]